MALGKFKFRWRRLKRRVFGAEQQFRGMTNKAIFERIYDEDMWGKNEDGFPCSGPGSHDPEIVGEYVDAVTGVLAEIGKDCALVDIGCGDFNIGSHIAPHVGKYIGCDVAENVIRANRARWQVPNVEFRALDIAKDDLPQSDVAIVRQVLQHLSNDDIAAFVNKVNQNVPFRHLIVTEHHYRGRDFVANRAKPSGSSLRVQIKSGVVLEDPPFNLNYGAKRVLRETEAPIWDLDAVIRTTHYALAA